MHGNVGYNGDNKKDSLLVLLCSPNKKNICSRDKRDADKCFSYFSPVLIAVSIILYCNYSYVIILLTFLSFYYFVIISIFIFY